MTTDEKEIITCECCGCIIEDGMSSNQTASGGYICEHCRDYEYGYCEDCEELVPIHELTEVNGKWICEDCLENSGNYFQCYDCDEWYPRRDRWGVNFYIRWDGEYICENCYSDGYGTCDDCGEIYHSDDLTEIDDEYYCPNCSRSKYRKIHEYGYKPQPEFKTIHDVFFDRVDRDGLYFGCELEIDDGCNREDCAEELTAASEDIYCKVDGSLHHNGLEIVTHPCTLDYHREVLPWRELSRIARDYDYSSHDTTTCGLHVHVGKYEFGEKKRDVCAKIALIVDRHWDNLVKFSRRKESELHDWSKRPMVKYDVDEIETLGKTYTNVRYSGRYQAVNLTNTNTVEFRLFKGSLKYETIMAAIELVSNIVKYAMNHPLDDIMKSQWADVAKLESYPELDDYLAQRNLWQVEDIAPNVYTNQEKIEVGDEVEIIGYDISDERWMTGLHARVVVIEESGVVGIDFFGSTACGFHNLEGRLPTNSGYWIFKKNLKLVAKKEGRACA